MSFRIRNIHTWMIIQKSKELGIEVNFAVPEKEDFLVLKKDSKTLIINRAISSNLKHISGAISEDKITCNYLLAQKGFPIPPFIFSNELSELEKTFLSENGPIVAKPYDTNKGTEIHMDIYTPDQLYQALEGIKKHSEKAILQKQAKGKDYRVLIINGKVEGVLWNEWPYVIGDGVSTIRELMIHENQRRANTKIDIFGRMTEMLVEIPLESFNEQLLRLELTETSIPLLQEKVYVGQCGNGWSGSIAHDVTDDVHESILSKSLEISEALDIDVAGLDIRCEDIQVPFEKSGFNLIEVNIRPSLVDHEFPLYGKSRNVTEKYLMYLFQEF